MASICCHSLPLPPLHNSPKPSLLRHFPTILPKPYPFSRPIVNSWSSGIRATNSGSSSTVRDQQGAQRPTDESMSIDNLHSFFNLNLGKWTGSFFVSVNFAVCDGLDSVWFPTKFRKINFCFCFIIDFPSLSMNFLRKFKSRSF